MTSNSRKPWVWFLIAVTALVFLPPVIGAPNFIPKTLWAAVSVAFGLMLLPPARVESRSISVLGCVWFAYMVWALLSSLWALQSRVVMERWVLLLLPTLAYLVAYRTRFWESRGFWTSFSILFLGIVSIGVLQFGKVHVARILSAVSGTVSLRFLEFVDYFPGTKAPRVTMGLRNCASMYVMVTIPFLGWVYFRERGWRVGVSYAALALGTLFLLVARTRGAWVGIICGVAFVVMAGGLKKMRRQFRKTAWLAGAVAVGLLTAAVTRPSDASDLYAKISFLHTALHILDPTSRLAMWTESFGITSPLLGGGLGNYGILATPHVAGETVRTLGWEVHNDYLQAYLDTGIPGLILFAGTFVALVWLGWRGRREGVVMAAGAAILGFSVMQGTTFTYEKMSSIMWIPGVAAILNAHRRAPHNITLKWPAAIFRAANVLAVGILICLSYVTVLSLRADMLFRDTMKRAHALDAILPEKRAFVERDLQRRVHWLAMDVLPTIHFDARMEHIYSDKFMDIAWELGDAEAALFLARNAVRLHPNDKTALTFLARRAFDSGRAEQGLRLLERAAAAYGYNPAEDVVQGLIGIYQSNGMAQEADLVRAIVSANAVETPALPAPADCATSIRRAVTLAWNDCGQRVSYDLYLWPEYRRLPAKPTVRGLKRSTYHPGRDLRAGTVYFWRVTARGPFESLTGPMWYFETAKEQRPTSEGGIEQQIAAAADVFDLMNLRERVGEDPGLLRQFRKRRSALLREYPGWRITEALDIEAFKYENVGEDTYRISMLFYVKGKPADHKRIAVFAYSDEEHGAQLPAGYHERGYLSWNFPLPSKISAWEPGEYVIIAREVNVPNIPLRMEVRVGSWRNKARIGWVADP